MDSYTASGLTGSGPEERGHTGPGGGADDHELLLPCRVYTHARRHPVVIGNIQGLRIPPVTPAQLFIGIGSLLVLLMTQSLWAHLGGALNSLVLLGTPLGLAFAARALRIEGRAPWRAGLGWLTLLSAPRRGTRLGRVERPDRRARRYRPAIWIAELGPQPAPAATGRTGR